MTTPPPGYPLSGPSGGAARAPVDGWIASGTPAVPVAAVALLGLLNLIWGFLPSWAIEARTLTEPLPMGSMFAVAGWIPAALFLAALVALGTLVPGTSRPTLWVVVVGLSTVGGLGALFFLLARPGVDAGLGFLLADDRPEDSASIGLILSVIFGLLQWLVAVGAAVMALRPRTLRMPRVYRDIPVPAGGPGYPAGAGAMPPMPGLAPDHFGHPPTPPAPDWSGYPQPGPGSAPVADPMSMVPFGSPQTAPTVSTVSPLTLDSAAGTEDRPVSTTLSSGSHFDPVILSPVSTPPPVPSPPPPAPASPDAPVFDPQSGMTVTSGLAEPFPAAPPRLSMPPAPPLRVAAVVVPPPGAAAAPPQEYVPTEYGSPDYVWEPTYSEAEAEENLDRPATTIPPEQAFLYDTPEWARPQVLPPKFDTGRTTTWTAETSEPPTDAVVPNPAERGWRSIPRAE